MKTNLPHMSSDVGFALLSQVHNPSRPQLAWSTQCCSLHADEIFTPSGRVNKGWTSHLLSSLCHHERLALIIQQGLKSQWMCILTSTPKNKPGRLNSVKQVSKALLGNSPEADPQTTVIHFCKSPKLSPRTVPGGNSPTDDSPPWRQSHRRQSSIATVRTIDDCT